MGMTVIVVMIVAIATRTEVGGGCRSGGVQNLFSCFWLVLRVRV